MAKEIPWEYYRSLLAVLQQGSLSGAARQLGVAQPTIGRHVTALERAFECTLFTRSQSGLLPTEAARELEGLAQTMQSTAAALARVAGSQGHGVRGTVRVTASEMVGVEVLPAIVAQLREKHPLLRIELVLSNELQDLLRRDADIAVRMTQPRQELLIARRIGEIKLGMHAHRSYLARHGTPSTWNELSNHALIGFDRPSAFIREAAKRLKWRRDDFALRSDNDLAQMALIRAGAGIGICQIPVARKDPNLQRVLSAQFSMGLDTWIVMHEDLRSSPRCKVAFDALVHGLKQHAGLGL